MQGSKTDISSRILFKLDPSLLQRRDVILELLNTICLYLRLLKLKEGAALQQQNTHSTTEEQTSQLNLIARTAELLNVYISLACPFSKVITMSILPSLTILSNDKGCVLDSHLRRRPMYTVVKLQPSISHANLDHQFADTLLCKPSIRCRLQWLWWQIPLMFYRPASSSLRHEKQMRDIRCCLIEPCLQRLYFSLIWSPVGHTYGKSQTLLRSKSCDPGVWAIWKVLAIPAKQDCQLLSGNNDCHDSRKQSPPAARSCSKIISRGCTPIVRYPGICSHSDG